MKKLLLSVSILFTLSATAQHQADNWFFGQLAGINFTSGIPVDTPGALNTTEGCSAISDNNGGALFYTDGVSVWNRNNQVMPNGTGLLGTVSSTQSALIVPMPGDSTKYYIFTVDEDGGPNGFEYSVVDMTLDGGLGDVSVKNVLILNNVTEKLTAVAQRVQGNYWVAVHEWGTDAFYAYPLTPAGLQTPVISHIGIVHSNAMIQYTYGQMKFNPCGTMIGAAIGYLDTVEVFDFNNGSGVISNPHTLPMANHVYGLEFSDDGSKLYVTCYDEFGTVLQFDLSNMQTDSIIASKTVLDTEPDMYGMQLAPDRKIYVVPAWSTMLHSIDFPNQPGVLCQYDLTGCDLDPNFMGHSAALGMPGFVTSFLKKSSCETITSLPLNENSGSFTISPNPLHYSTQITFSEELSKRKLILKIYDALNHLVRQEKINSSVPYTLNRNDLAAGIYYLQMQSKDVFQVQKLIVE